jgi:hypothetical protein
VTALVLYWSKTGNTAKVAGALQEGLQAAELDVTRTPVDTMSAGERYAEQSTAWHLVNAPGTRRRTTLTRSDLVTFEG